MCNFRIGRSAVVEQPVIGGKGLYELFVIGEWVIDHFKRRTNEE